MYWKSFTIHKPTKQPNQNTIHKPTKQPNQTEMFQTKMDELRWDHAFFNVDGSSHCTILTAPGCWCSSHCTILTAPGCWCSTLDVFRWLLLNLLAGDIVQSWLHRAVDAQHWMFSAGCCLTFWLVILYNPDCTGLLMLNIGCTSFNTGHFRLVAA